MPKAFILYYLVESNIFYLFYNYLILINFIVKKTFDRQQKN